MFRNILDSTKVPVENDVTCLVGKNESGKTAFLQALCLLNPARSNLAFSVSEQYPAWREKQDRMKGVNIDESKPVAATFELSRQDLFQIEKHFGPNTIITNKITLHRTYSGKLTVDIKYKELNAVRHVIANVRYPNEDVRKKLNSSETFEELISNISALKDASSQDLDLCKALSSIEEVVQAVLTKNSFWHKLYSLIEPRIPKFFYFANFSKLPYSTPIAKLLSKKLDELSDEEATTRALLKLGGADKDYLLNTDFEQRKRELENISNAITSEVLKYWSQNQEMRVQPDITQITQKNHPNGPQTVIDELKLRIWDNRHFLSLPFNQHSTGFQWFFSFLAAFSEYEYSEAPVVILLDEPALGLHAKAQADFLKFIDERLAKKCQVIYTTHSPFMVEPGHLERVRLVEDKGIEKGTIVTQDILTTDRDTLFPLQGALGYDLVQHLFVSQNNIVVEGPSDYSYLSIISDYLKTKGRCCLDERWSIIPVGGADAIPSFVALLGNHLDVTVLVDSRKEGHQRLTKMSQLGLLRPNRLISIGEFLKVNSADIEDLFEVEDYLAIFNQAFNTTFSTSNLIGDGPIVGKLARLQGVNRFDHGKPADQLLRNRDKLLPMLSETSLERFEQLFKRINETIRNKHKKPKTKNL